MPKVKGRVEQAAPEIYAKLARAMGEDKVVIYGGAAVAFWTSFGKEPSDIDIAVMGRRYEIELKIAESAEGFNADPWLMKPNHDFHLVYMPRGSILPVNVHLNPCESHIFGRRGLPAEIFFANSVMIGEDGSWVRVLDKAALIFTAWLAFKSRYKDKDINAIFRMLDAHYNGSALHFVENEAEKIRAVTGPWEEEFVGAILDLRRDS
ncbi:MAG: hypothetical protein KGH72_02600 [Candidatus Micrarchaeota archaeon]|nr:hypothetical protein [Candidatus Micrarchaeota archaeon]